MHYAYEIDAQFQRCYVSTKVQALKLCYALRYFRHVGIRLCITIANFIIYGIRAFIEVLAYVKSVSKENDIVTCYFIAHSFC